MRQTLRPPLRSRAAVADAGMASAATRLRRGLEAKFQPLQGQAPAIADVAADGTITGYASLFGVADQGGDLVAPGAFAASLTARGANQVRLLFQHDPAEPIGVWEEIVEDARGLRVRGRLLPDVSRGAEVLALMRAGAVDGLSIGYRAVRAHRDGRGLRVLTEIDLWEVSIVTFPMLPDARVSSVKGEVATGPTRDVAPTRRTLPDVAPSAHST